MREIVRNRETRGRRAPGTVRARAVVKYKAVIRELGQVLNAERSPDDPRDVPFLGNTAKGLPPLALHTRFRRSGLGPVLNQHKTGTCGGHAGIGLRQWQEKLGGHEVTDFDPFRLYDLCLEADGHSDPDRLTGTTARTVMNVLKKTGTPLKDGGLAGKIAAYEGIPDPNEEAIKEAILAEGRTNRQIAETLFIAENTAGVHVSRILGKLGAASRTEAASIAHRAGLDHA
jgi:DNA-binding CsgD family transcriptional regulator